MTGESASRLDLACRAVLGYARMQRGAARSLIAATEFAGGFFSQALTPEEMLDATLVLFERTGYMRPGVGQLFAWEREWYAKTLPAPGARILVGGAGGGREVVALRGQGYEIDAFDPVSAAVEECRRVIGEGDCARGSYEDLSAALLDGQEGPLSFLGGRTFDAVILGWGSFSHVLRAPERERLLRAACLLAPQGPVLASFIRGGEERQSRERRARRAGLKVGALVRRWRTLQGQADESRFIAHVGFYHAFARPEIIALGEAIGRPAVWETDPAYGHAAFLPGLAEGGS